MGRGYQTFLTVNHHACSAVFGAIVWSYCFIKKVESWYPPDVKLKTSCKKWRLQNLYFKGFVQKSSRMHIQKTLFHSKCDKKIQRLWRKFSRTYHNFPDLYLDLCKISWKVIKTKRVQDKKRLPMFKYTLMEVPPFISNIWKHVVVNYTNNYREKEKWVTLSRSLKDPWKDPSNATKNQDIWH